VRRRPVRAPLPPQASSETLPAITPLADVSLSDGDTDVVYFFDGGVRFVTYGQMARPRFLKAGLTATTRPSRGDRYRSQPADEREHCRLLRRLHGPTHRENRQIYDYLYVASSGRWQDGILPNGEAAAKGTDLSVIQNGDDTTVFMSVPTIRSGAGPSTGAGPTPS
jgi:hypothetical protein